MEAILAMKEKKKIKSSYLLASFVIFPTDLNGQQLNGQLVSLSHGFVRISSILYFIREFTFEREFKVKSYSL